MVLLTACIRHAYNNPVDDEPADNSFCFVCHNNFDGERLALNHEIAGIGCENCHGPSNEHSSDEDGLTPPDIMYSKKNVNPACMKCHLRDNIKNVSSHRAFIAGNDSDHKYCTDCHGKKHHIAVRTRRWDKQTKKLIYDDGVRMMESP